MTAQPLDGLADEQAVGAGDAASVQPRSSSLSSSSTIEPPVAISSSRTMTVLPATSPTIASMTTRVVGEPLLAAGGDREAEQAGELGGRLGVAQVGRDDDGVGEVARRGSGRRARRAR